MRNEEKKTLAPPNTTSEQSSFCCQVHVDVYRGVQISDTSLGFFLFFCYLFLRRVRKHLAEALEGKREGVQKGEA